jgi:hypothetical protein
MVLVRFAIAEATLRGEHSAPAKPAAASRPAVGAAPARPPILGMPEQSLFDATRLNKELQAAPLDLRGGDDQVRQRLAGLMPEQAIEIVTRGQLATLDGQAAFVQVSRREPRVTATVVTRSGRANTLTMASVGMIAAFTPRVSEKGRIIMQVDVEKSDLGPADEGAVIFESSTGEKVRTPNVQTTNVLATVGIASGQAVALAGVSTRQGPRRTEFLILLSAELLERN